MLSVFITPWMKPTPIHCATSRACRAITALQQAAAGPSALGIVARDGVVGQQRAAPRRRRARRRYWKVPTRMWLAATRVSTAPGSGASRMHLLAGGDRGQRAGGRHAERVHRLGHDVFAQHRAQPGAPVAPAGIGRAARALELDVAAPAVAVHHLAQQHRAPVAQLRVEAAELVAGIGLRQRLGALGHARCRPAPRPPRGVAAPSASIPSSAPARRFRRDQLRRATGVGAMPRVEAARAGGRSCCRRRSRGSWRVSLP